MSMTSDEYTEWCTEVSSINQEIFDLVVSKKEFFDWMEGYIREFFEEFGKVVNINFEHDGSSISVRLENNLKLDAKAFATLPFCFTVEAIGRELIFTMKPHVVSMDELKKSLGD